MAFTHVKIRNAKPSEIAYKLTDEKGLFLFITPNGGSIGGLNIGLARRRKTGVWGVF
jgi:hypothetical protein